MNTDILIENLLVVAVVLIIAFSCAGCTNAQKFAITGHTADMISTRIALDDGAKELNPLLSENPSNAELIGLKVIGGVIIWLTVEHTMPESWHDNIYYALGLVGFGAAGWNLSL